jgi:hypothetical protein
MGEHSLRSEVVALKNTKSKTKSRTQYAAVGAVMVIVYLVIPAESALKQAATWQGMASPGDLSRAHANLSDDCAACHTSVQGVDEAKCILCHADNPAILQRQPTAFHASIGTCKECHVEHKGMGTRPTKMDHEAVSRIGLRALEREPDQERQALHDSLQSWARIGGPVGPGTKVSRLEALLACDSCHAKQDRHFGLFGADCAQCHAIDRWTLPEFRHPSPQSRDCAQCHQAPPSHYMGHFKMVSAKVARKPRAKVAQCFECHRTTAWTDIPGIGFYKHH